MHPLETTFHVFSAEKIVMLSLSLALPSWAARVMLMLLPVLMLVVILTLTLSNYFSELLLSTRLCAKHVTRKVLFRLHHHLGKPVLISLQMRKWNLRALSFLLKVTVTVRCKIWVWTRMIVSKAEAHSLRCHFCTAPFLAIKASVDCMRTGHLWIYCSSLGTTVMAFFPSRISPLTCLLWSCELMRAVVHKRKLREWANI